MSKNRMHKLHSGFTLMEMLIVVAIIAILIAIAIPLFTSALESSREATCLANRRSMSAVIAADAMTTGQSEADIFAQMNPTREDQSFTCPDNGTWTWNAATRSITCSAHPGEESQSNDGKSSTFLATWKSFVGDYSGFKNNDAMRDAFFKENDPLPTLTTNDGTQLTVQPFYQGSSGDSWLFAKTGTSNGWYVSYVCDPADGKWYRYVKSNGETTATSINTYADADAIHTAVTSPSSDTNHWVPLTDYTIS